MDNEVLIKLGIELGEIMVNNTVSSLMEKIALSKAKKNDKETINILEEIINDLIEDKNKLNRIALEYKDTVEKTHISEENILYLHNTIKNLLPMLSIGDDIPKEQINLILSLVSVDTLKTMQLLGFNYKKAIGEPLTELTSSFILSKSSVKGNKKKIT